MMHKHAERRHHKRDYEGREKSHKHSKSRHLSSEFEDEGYEEISSKRKHKKKRKDSQSEEEINHEHKKRKHDLDIQDDAKPLKRTHDGFTSSREVITINEKSSRQKEELNQNDSDISDRDLEKNCDSKNSRQNKNKISKRNRSTDDRRDKKVKKCKKEESSTGGNYKRNKPHNTDSEEDKGRKTKEHKKEKHRKRVSDNSEEESSDGRRGQKKYKEDKSDDEGRNDEDEGRRRKSRKQKKYKRYEEEFSHEEEGHYQSRDSERRKRRKDKRRDRGGSASEDSELENISRPVGSRYYEVSRPYDEHQVTYKESQVQLGSRYYGEDKKENKKVSPKRGKETNDDEKKPEATKTSTNILSSKTGGAYIPPAKLKLMQQQISDKSSVEYQRISWEALKKSIHGSVNKVNTGNIGIIARKLFQENIIRGRGLLTRSILQAQAASPTFTNVYAALVDIINSKFPSIAELLLNRCIQQFKRCFKRNDKALCINSVTFIAHLVNQQVAHEIIVLEILTLLVETPTNDSIEVACALLKECGKKLTELSSKGVTAIFSMLLNILHEGKLEKRVQYMIEVLAQVRKDNFKDFPDVIEELDLVPEEDKFTHLMTLDGVKDTQDILNVFQFDPEFQTNEEKYQTLKTEILGDDEDDEDGDDEEGDTDEESEEEEKENQTGTTEGATPIIDNTETNLVALRRVIYLTIHSSLDFEECAHKLLKMQLKPGQESELCHMFLDCCAEQRTYEKFFGLLAQRFCQINRIYIAPLEQIFRDSYATVHRLDINKLRNVAKFFAHQLFTDAIGWHVLSCIHLNEEETTSSGRIFIKILFQELSEYMGLSKLNQKIKDPLLAPTMEGVFPRDNPKNTRFAINFFTSIGLGGLTDELREHLKSAPKAPLMLQNLSSPSSSSSSSTSSSSSSSSSESSTSEDERERRRRKKKTKKKK